jgi:hypothetical protein
MMMMPLCFLLKKAWFLVWVLPVLFGCVAGGVMVRKDDLSDLQVRLDAVETQLAAQTAAHASYLEQLLDSTERLDLALDQQHRLLLLDIEQNTRAFEYLEEYLRQIHNETRSRLAALRTSTDAEPDMQTGLQVAGTDKLLVGEIEKVRLTPPGRVFHARIDTGATTSSLDARDIARFERDGSAWVRFKIKDPDSDTLYELEKPVVRRVRIVQSGNAEPDRRPVVKLQIQLGRLTLSEEFTLVDRTHLDYQVLIGRNILRDLLVVDVARKFIVPPLAEPETKGNGKP